MNKLVFIIGMRRAGTSILRSLLMQHPQINHIEFEPHDLLFAVGTKHITRYNKSKYHRDTIARFYNKEKHYIGAKIVCNPYLSALGWKFLKRYYPDAKYVFIRRDWEDNYSSWYREDKNSVRGIIPKDMYKYFYDKINKSFDDHINSDSENCCLINYEDLVLNADKELEKVWTTLNLSQRKGFNSRMKKPRHWSSK